ncbi:MAG: sorbosone dehydrogenase family protein [Fimbriimonas sp.]
MLSLFIAAVFVQGRVLIQPQKLPKPGTTTSKISIPKVIPRPAGSGLSLPKGFRANVFARGLRSPRWLLVAPNGDVLCVECYQGRVQLLRDSDGDGVAEEKHTFASGLKLPFGLALHDGYLYVANTGSVVRFPYRDGQTKAEVRPEVVVPEIPSRGYNQHWTRNLILSPDGKTMYVTVGSETNHDVERPPRASILAFKSDGSGMRTYADGLRNPVGLAFRPGTDELWATCVERDFMGDDLVPDFITRVEEGDFFGWPWYYIGRHRDPHLKGKLAPAKPVKVPDVLTVAHSVPLGLLFYTGKQFPAEYRGDLFVALRGSTNRRLRSGYEVIRIRFRDGKLVPGYETFIGGWITDRRKKEVYGRPVGLAQLPDGSLLVADEGAHLVWRITYH